MVEAAGIEPASTSLADMADDVLRRKVAVAVPGKDVIQ